MPSLFLVHDNKLLRAFLGGVGEMFAVGAEHWKTAYPIVELPFFAIHDNEFLVACFGFANKAPALEARFECSGNYRRPINFTDEFFGDFSVRFLLRLECGRKASEEDNCREECNY